MDGKLQRIRKLDPVFLTVKVAPAAALDLHDETAVLDFAELV